MTTLDILRQYYGATTRLIRYLDGSIGIRINNVTWATEIDNCAYYVDTNEYNQRHTLNNQVWQQIRSEENEMVRVQEAS